MLDALIYLIVMLVVGGVLYYILQRAVALFKLPPPIGAAIEIIALLIFLVFIIGIFFGGIDVGHPVWRH